MYIDGPLATSVIGEFGMAFGITIVVAMFIGKIGEETNDLTPNHKSRQSKGLIIFDCNVQ
jgi:hypothetical protein